MRRRDEYVHGVPVLRQPPVGLSSAPRIVSSEVGHDRVRRLMQNLMQSGGHLPGVSNQPAPSGAQGLIPICSSCHRTDLVTCHSPTSPIFPFRRAFCFGCREMDWARAAPSFSWKLSNTLDAHFCTDALERSWASPVEPIWTPVQHRDRRSVKLLRPSGPNAKRAEISPTNKGRWSRLQRPSYA